MAHDSNEIPKAPPRGPGSGPPAGGGEQAKDFKTAIKKLAQYSSSEKPTLLLAICFAMGGAILTLIGPSQLSKLTDAITAGMMSSIDMDEVRSIGTFMIAVYGGSFCLTLTQGFLMASTVQKIAKRLRYDISEKINRLPMAYFSTHSKGDVLSRVTNDVDTINQSLSQSVGTFISCQTLLLGSLLMMFLTNTTLAMTALLSVAGGFFLITRIMKKAQGFFKNQQKHLGAINGHIEEMYAGHTVVRAYHGEREAIDHFNEINDQLKNAAFQAQALSGLMMPIMTFIGNFGYVAVCIVGAILALSGSITFGTIVAFMVYIRLFTQPLGQMAQSVQQLQSASAAAERAFEFLEETEMPDESQKNQTLDKVEGRVRFENIRFGYTPEKIIINNFSATVQAGQKIAIVGPTGAGKTTIINLLMGFFDPNSGTIYIDDIPTNAVKRSHVHKNFSMVLQDTWIFEGTLRENLVYATPNVSDETLNHAVKAVGLHHFVKTLEKGYNTLLNDTLELSQGQKQQITIARAMIADKPMLILDEATSSIDTRTELIIQKAMDELMANRTSFVIAHRLSTIKNADMILVMKDGDVIESGNHDTLLEAQGFYAELYNSQFDTQESE